LLANLLNPHSVAIVGASDDVGKLRGKLLHVLRRGGFQGTIYPVNPGRLEIQALPAYRDLKSLPVVPELVMIAVPGAHVAAVLRDAEELGVASAVVFSADVDPLVLASVAEAGKLRVVGPNTEGFYDTGTKLAATFAGVVEEQFLNEDVSVWPGRKIAIVSQSGGLGFALYGRAIAEHLPVSGVYTTGNEADLECLDFVEHLVDEGEVGVILMFIEGLKNPRRLPAIAGRAAAKRIPIVVMKVGRSEAGQRAALSHTAHLAGADTAYDAYFERFGIIRVFDQEEMLSAAAAFSRLTLGPGKRAAVVTTSGGAGAWAADLCGSYGVDVPETDSPTAANIAQLIPGFGATGNPIDVTAQAVEDGGATLVKVLEQLCASSAFDAVIVNMGLSKIGRIAALRGLLQPLLSDGGKPVLFHSHIRPEDENIRALAALGGHVFPTLRGCAFALHVIDRYHRFLQAEQPPAAGDGVKAIEIESSGSVVLTESETRRIMEAYAIPVPPSVLAQNLDEAMSAAREMGFPVVVKIQSPDIAHKTEIGGVALGVGEAELPAAYERIIVNAVKAVPDALIEGILIQKMMPPGHEIVLGVVNDADFGPLVMLGAGGIYVEVLKDVVFSPPQIDEAEARRLIRRLKTAPILLGARGRKPADETALARLIVAVGRLAIEQEGVIDQLDLNPVFVYPQGEGVVAVDALVTRKEQA